MPYKYAPPALTDLNRDQRMAHGFDGANVDVLILTGCPGSGKTTVSMLRNGGRDCSKRHYAVYANLLRGYLINSAGQLNVPESFSAHSIHGYGAFRVGGILPLTNPNILETSFTLGLPDGQKFKGRSM